MLNMHVAPVTRSIQCLFGAITCTCLKMAINLKSVGTRAKSTENWDSKTLMKHIWCIFNLVAFKIISGPFGAFVLKRAITQQEAQGPWRSAWSLARQEKVQFKCLPGMKLLYVNSYVAKVTRITLSTF